MVEPVADPKLPLSPDSFSSLDPEIADGAGESMRRQVFIHFSLPSPAP